jgi:hypothetical protein
VLDRLELLPKSKKSNVTRRFQMMIDDLSSIQD